MTDTDRNRKSEEAFADRPELGPVIAAARRTRRRVKLVLMIVAAVPVATGSARGVGFIGANTALLACGIVALGLASLVLGLRLSGSLTFYTASAKKQ